MNTPTEILVITNGKAVIVPADKWPEEPKLYETQPVYNQIALKNYKIQKEQAIAQGAVVEYDVTQPDSYKSNYALAKIVPCDFNAPATLKDGAYPIDPSKWVVEKQWQYRLKYAVDWSSEPLQRGKRGKTGFAKVHGINQFCL